MQFVIFPWTRQRRRSETAAPRWLDWYPEIIRDLPRQMSPPLYIEVKARRPHSEETMYFFPIAPRTAFVVDISK